MDFPAVRVSPGRHDFYALLIAVVVVVFDQTTKAIIVATIDRGDSWPSEDWPIRLVHITNSGAAFGVLQDTGPLLVVASFIGVAIILAYMFTPGLTDPVLRYGLALMLGGALGNLIDRFTEGEVVDFIHFPRFPSFNVADSAITIGVLLLLWALMRGTPEDPQRAVPSSPDSRDDSTP